MLSLKTSLEIGLRRVRLAAQRKPNRQTPLWTKRLLPKKTDCGSVFFLSAIARVVRYNRTAPPAI